LTVHGGRIRNSGNTVTRREAVLNSAAEGCCFPNFREGYVGVVGYWRPVVAGVQRYPRARREGQGRRQVDLISAEIIIAQNKIEYDVIVSVAAVQYVDFNSSAQIMLSPPVIGPLEADRLE